jgi:hypothetical protein
METYPITPYCPSRPCSEGVEYGCKRPPCRRLAHDSEELRSLDEGSETEVWHLEYEVGGLEAEGLGSGGRGGVSYDITAPELVYRTVVGTLDPDLGCAT